MLETQEIWQEPPAGGLVEAALLTKPWRDVLRLIHDGHAPQPPIAHLCGRRLIDLNEGQAVLAMPASAWFCGPKRRLDAGIFAFLADMTHFYAVLAETPRWPGDPSGAAGRRAPMSTDRSSHWHPPDRRLRWERCLLDASAWVVGAGDRNRVLRDDRVAGQERRSGCGSGGGQPRHRVHRAGSQGEFPATGRRRRCRSCRGGKSGSSRRPSHDRQYRGDPQRTYARDATRPAKWCFRGSSPNEHLVGTALA